MDSVVFFEATGVRQLSDGNIVVLDGGDRSLKFFDANGALTYRTGRQGSGPGEFEYPVLVPDPATDSLLVWDIRRVRLSNATGQRATVDTIVQRYYLDTSPGGVRQIGEIPFTAASSAVVRGTEAWLTRGGAARIQVHDLDGKLIRSIRVNGIRRSVTAADLNGLIDAMTLNSNISRDYWERTYSARPIPDSLPTFVSMMVDVRGHVWAEVYEWDTAVPTEWIVFESSGRALGSVRTPRGLEIHQVGTNFILGVRKDSDGIDWVERYVLVRDTSEATRRASAP
jgi:hypothetical protein